MWVRERKLNQEWRCQRNDVRGLIGRTRNSWGVQTGGSSWAKRIVVLRTKNFGMWVLYNLFICVVKICLMDCCMSYWALLVAMTWRGVLYCCIFHNFVVLKIKGDCYVGYLFLVVLLMLGLLCLVKYRMRSVWLIVFIVFADLSVAQNVINWKIQQLLYELRLLVWLLQYILRMCFRFVFRSQKKNPKKLNIACYIVNLSMM